MNPSRTQVKGEIRKGRSKNWPSSWFLDSESHVQSKDARRHIAWILDQLENKSEMIQQLRDGVAQIRVSCLWTSAKGHVGPVLDAEILGRLAALDLGIAFDLYFEGDDSVHEGLRPRILEDERLELTGSFLAIQPVGFTCAPKPSAGVTDFHDLRQGFSPPDRVLALLGLQQAEA